VPVFVAEKLDVLDSEDLGGGALLLLADRDQLGVLLLRVLATLPAVGDDDVGDLGAAVGQPCDRATRAEVGSSGWAETTITRWNLGSRPLLREFATSRRR